MPLISTKAKGLQGRCLNRSGEFSAPPGEIPQGIYRGSLPSSHRAHRKGLCFEPSPERELAQDLPFVIASSDVFRAALLSIVLTLAGGQNAAALFCGIWCHSVEGMAGACEQQGSTTSPAVSANDCKVNGSVIVFVREDARRSTSAPTDVGAAFVPRFAFTPPAAGILSAYEPRNRQLLELRPLVLALRI